MNNRIIEIMKRVFGTENVTPDTTQQNCDKWDSLRHLNLIVELEDAFDTEFEPEEIAEMKSVSAIAEVISSKK